MENLKECDKLIEKIDRELSWRKKELTQLKFIVSSASPENENTVLRSSIVLLYAHWEGFVKMALTFYLKHIVDQQLHCNELKPNFYAMSLLSEFEKYKTTKKVKPSTNRAVESESHSSPFLPITVTETSPLSAG